MGDRGQLAIARRIVVKVGSGLLTDGGANLDSTRMKALADDVAAAIEQGRDVALVSSGAIVAGMARLGLSERPRSIPEKQAAAAVGQSHLMQLWETAFRAHGRSVGQILLTRSDISDRARYLNARNTLRTLLSYGVVPVVNENDTVAIDEIKVGDNDNLSAFVAHLLDADLLVLLTDVDGLYHGDPSRDPEARKLDVVEAVTPDIEQLVWADGRTAVGGMATKLQAARKAAASGVPMVIASGRESGTLAAVLRGETVGTYFPARGDRLAARKRWIAFAVPPHGRLRVDAGARAALTRLGKSLLPSGLVDVEGEFEAGAVVAVCADGADAAEFARGLVNFDSEELRKIRRAHTRDIEALLGYRSFDEVIHRDNLVVL